MAVYDKCRSCAESREALNCSTGKQMVQLVSTSCVGSLQTNSAPPPVADCVLHMPGHGGFTLLMKSES